MEDKTKTKATEKKLGAVQAPPAAPADAPPAPAAPTPKLITAEQWARGRNDAITRAFVSEHTRGVRTTKRAASEWMGLYKAFLNQPRG